MLLHVTANTDIATVNRYAQESPANMVRVGLMVLLSIRQPWHSVGQQMQQVKAEGLKCPHLFGFKKDGFQYLQANSDSLYAAMLATDDPCELIDLFATVPGFGLAKAGFMVQLCRGMVGCLDSHNIRLYDISAGMLRLPNTLTAKTRHAKIVTYVKLCEELGGSTLLWREWCNFIAGRYPTIWRDALEVSSAHWKYPLNMENA